jgi:Cu(I)/Ag(I) efflux system membrane fusion protein
LLQKQDKNSTLTAQSHQRMLLFGISETQISDFEKNGTAPPTVTLYSPYEGYAVPSEPMKATGGSMTSTSGGSMSEMNVSNSNDNQAGQSLQFREGAYITAGQTLFSINDAKEVIALLSVSPGSTIRSGMPLEITSELLPGQKINSAVNLVEPAQEAGQRFLYARAVLQNSNGQLSYNSLVKATTRTSTGLPNTLPSACVLDLGKRKIVWVKTKEVNQVSVFMPRIVVTGFVNDGYTEILSGLSTGEEVAQDAGLLVDREGIIQTELP